MSRLRPFKGAAARFWRGFARDRRGVSAIEFALIAPFFILLYVGMAELSQGMSAQRRASHAASTIGDLIAQTDTLKAADIDDVLNGATTIMRPFTDTTLKRRVTSVTADSNGNPKAAWSRGIGLTKYAKGASVTIPAGLMVAGDNLIFAETTYTYTSPVASVLTKPLDFNEKFYLKARKGVEVKCSDCP